MEAHRVTHVTPLRERRRPTQADVDALPQDLRGEIVAGQLVALPRPTTAHAHALKGLTLELVPPFERGRGGPGGWLLMVEVELHLGVDPNFEPIIPDMCGWQVDGPSPGLVGQKFVAQVPDFVCEVLSPSTAARDRTEKMPFYARAGIGWAWLADPETRVLEAYENDGGRWVLLGAWYGAQSVAVAPFDAVPFPLESLWETLEARVSAGLDQEDA